MRMTTKLLTLLANGGASAPAPFSDDFTRSDGELGNGWNGSTWAIVSGKAVNTPATFGDEKLADPGLEANYTAGQCDSWAAKAGTPTLAQSADVHGGSKAQEYTSTAANNDLRMLGTPSTATLGRWYQASEWVKRTAGANNNQQFQLRSTLFSHSGVRIDAAAYTQIFTQTMCTTVNSMSMYGVFTVVGGSHDTILMDDQSLKEMTTAELMASQAFGAGNYTAQVGATLPTGVFGGLVVDLDSASDPQNYVLCIISRQGTLQAIKVVAGTPTVLIAGSIFSPYADGRLIKVVKSGTTYKFYYNNAQIGTDQTISDAGIISNTYHGMFATHSTVQLDSFSIA